ncbi:MAG: tripartite tricarboxylate transporter TctB family protein [Rhizobacter sp.]
MSTAAASPARLQLLVGLGVVGLSVVMAVGAWVIPSTAGYAGVGPNFLPWVVSGVLLVCGALLMWHATHGGYRAVEAPSGAARGDWRALAWVSAGVLAIAGLITPIGFVFACALGFTLAVRGLRGAEGKPHGDLKQTVIDALVGLAIAAPVFWLFRQLLAINLPGLTGTGWI